jgi:hypothetical protein
LASAGLQMIPILLQYPALLNTEGQHGKSNQSASAASCGAARSAVARREVRPSDFRDRVAKRFGNIPKNRPTEANNIGSFKTENGAGATGEMGEGSEWIEASSGGRKGNWFGTREAHHVGVSPQEDRSSAAEKVGSGEGGEEGGIVSSGSLLRVYIGALLKYWSLLGVASAERKSRPVLA